MSLIGAKVLRKEDPNLVTGRGSFVDDLRPDRCLTMAFVPSTEAHARVRSVDASEAAALPGVAAVWTAADVAHLPPCPGLPGLERPLLASDVVRFVGEPVAVVVAEDRYLAADAVAAVVVDYEPLPAVVGVQAALAADAPALFPALGGNLVFEQPWESDLADVFAAAPRTASLHIVNNRCAPTPIEPNACLADWGPSGLTLWAAFQAPHHLRNKLAEFFGIAHDETRVIAPDVGGGFGAKINLVPELYLAPALSRALGRPVKYVQTRSECLQAMYHGRAQEQDVDVAFDDDGRLLGLRFMVTQDNGGYPDPGGMGLPALTTAMATGCYKVPRVAVGWRNVVTNTTPVASYRGAGRPEATFMIERVVDLVADETGLDPLEVRRRNFIQPDEFPYATSSPLAVYDSGNYPGALDELLRILDYDAVRQEQRRNLDDDTKPLIGVGFSTWVEIAGFGPPGSLEAFGHLGSWESAQIRVQPDGSAIVYTGASPHGQGTETTFAQIAADNLGIPFERISVRHGDTATVLQGIGTMGSRCTAIAGEGVRAAATTVLGRAKEIAAHLLEADPADLQAEDGAFTVRGTPARSVSWNDVAWASFRPLDLPEGMTPGSLETSVFQQVANFSFPSGAYACVVEVDRHTGRVGVRGFYLVDDCGTVINPLLAEGQVQGGIAQGIAQALFEEVSYDPQGALLTSTLMDYLVPAAPDLPGFVSSRICTPTPNSVLGAKGIGESGSIGSPPAVVNAVVDALAHLGVRHVDMPVTPQKVWRLLEGAR